MAKMMKERLAVLQSALDLIRAIDVGPQELLSYAIAVDAEQEANEWNADEPDDHMTPSEMIYAELDALLDDGSRDFVRDVWGDAHEMRQLMDGEEAE